jgi:hypothetical protein
VLGKNNIILHGIKETEQSYTQLMEIVVSTLDEVSEKAGKDKWDKWEVSSAQRLGRKTNNKIRPLLITITLAWRKWEILSNNKHFKSGTYATDDFPKEVLEKRKELKKEMQEATKNGKIAKLRYDKLIIIDKPSEKRKRPPSSSPTTGRNETKNTPNKINRVNAFEVMRQKPSTSTNSNEA